MTQLKDILEKSGVFTYPLDVPIGAGARKSIESALWIIERHLEHDWEESCEKPECTVANPLCTFMEYESAKTRLFAILNPIHRSLNPDRLGNAAEEIFLRKWQKENERQRGLNNGYGLLELLLTPTRIRSELPKWLPNSSGPYYVPPISQRDAEVAATVIQWLGTNCGLCFVRECEKEIEQARAERNDMEIERFGVSRELRNERILPMYENIAREAANRVLRPDNPKYAELVTSILAAIQVSHKQTDYVAGAC